MFSSHCLHDVTLTSGRALCHQRGSRGLQCYFAVLTALRCGVFQFAINARFYVKVSGLHGFLQPDIIENQHLISLQR